MWPEHRLSIHPQEACRPSLGAPQGPKPPTCLGDLDCTEESISFLKVSLCLVPRFNLPLWASELDQQLSQSLMAGTSLGSVAGEFLLPLKALSPGEGGAKGCQEESWGQGCQLTFHFHSLITRLIKALGLCRVEGALTVDNNVCQGLCAG